MDTVIVTATALSLRSSPGISNDNRITTLPHGQIAEVTDRSTPGWLRIQTRVGQTTLTGYSVAKYLKPERESTPSPTFKGISAVNFAPGRYSRLDSTVGRIYPLTTPSITKRVASDSSGDKVRALRHIIDMLDVEHSARYQPTSHSTFCNIYAYDYCYFADAYLPRVWWTSRALVRLAQGEAVEATYGTTVRELNANALFDWLTEWGDDFGWSRVFDLDNLQHAINEGGVAVICGRRRVPSRSGHITCVAPETAEVPALRQAGKIVAPVQSQAGARNKRYFATAWWVERAAEYFDCGYFLHA